MRKSRIIILLILLWLAFGCAVAQADDVMHTLRMQAIQQLIEKGFDRRETMPFGEPWSDYIHLTGSQTYPDYPDYSTTTGINVQDDLDILLEKKISNLGMLHTIAYKLFEMPWKGLIFDDAEIKDLQKVYLFKTEQDLKDLWYVVSSYRTRINNDQKRRSDNIMISYNNIGNVRVLNPDQELSFMTEVHYEPDTYKLAMVDGWAIMWGLTRVKWGGICWASRGINTLILPNKAFEITLRYNHSRTYKNLYQNEINGQEYWIPGLDIAVYAMPGSTKDYKFKNIRPYPVVMVLNYDGTLGTQEELFVLSKAEDRGELVYKERKGNCFYREANGNPFKSCYGSVLW